MAAHRWKALVDALIPRDGLSTSVHRHAIGDVDCVGEPHATETATAAQLSMTPIVRNIHMSYYWDATHNRISVITA